MTTIIYFTGWTRERIKQKKGKMMKLYLKGTGPWEIWHEGGGSTSRGKELSSGKRVENTARKKKGVREIA